MVLEYIEDHVKVNLIYSSYHELISSLHVLYQPEHHTIRYAWAKTMYVNLTSDMQDKVKYYGDITKGYMGLYASFVDGGGCKGTVKEAVKRLQQMDIYTFADLIINEGEIEKEAFESLRCETFREGCLTFLMEYYEEYLANELQFSQPLLLRQLRISMNNIKEKGVYSYIHDLHPRIEVTSDKINFHKYKLFDIRKERLKEINLYVDSFVMPHLLLGINEEHGQLNLTIPVVLSSYDKGYMPEDILSLFKSLGDGSRLKILKCLYNKPCSTQCLATELELTEACISKHLKALYAAKVVWKKRQGTYIYYYLNQRTIDGLVMYLYEYLA